MKAIYTDSEIKDAVKEKKKMLAIWLVTLAVFIAIEVTMFVIFVVRVETSLDRSLQTPFTTISAALAVLYSCLSLLFFGVKYRYVKAYVNMYKAMKEGTKDKSYGVVLAITENLTEKDAVKFYRLELECAPVRRGERNLRTLLIEKNHKIDDIAVGDKIEFIAHSSIMLGYEILSRAEENK